MLPTPAHRTCMQHTYAQHSCTCHSTIHKTSAAAIPTISISILYASHFCTQDLHAARTPNTAAPVTPPTVKYQLPPPPVTHSLHLYTAQLPPGFTAQSSLQLLPGTYVLYVYLSPALSLSLSFSLTLSLSLSLSLSLLCVCVYVCECVCMFVCVSCAFLHFLISYKVVCAIVSTACARCVSVCVQCTRCVYARACMCNVGACGCVWV